MNAHRTLLTAAALLAALALAACGSDSGNGGGNGGANPPAEEQIQAFNDAFCLWTCTDQVECDTGAGITLEQCLDACPNPAAPSPHITFGNGNALCMALGITFYQCEIDAGCDVRDTGACDDQQRAFSQGC